MIKVCHISSAHKNEDVRIFYKECVSLAKAGYDVYFVCQGESERKKSVTRVGLPSAKNRLHRMFFMARKAYNRAKQIDAEIYHIHDPELLPYALKLHKSGKKVIFDSHEYYFEQIKNKSYIPSFLRTLVANLYKTYETYVCKKIDAVISPCTMGGKDIFYERSKRSIYIDNTPILDEWYHRYNEDREKKENIACYTGTLSYGRGITQLIKACAQTQTKLVLAGVFSPRDYEKQLRINPEYQCVEYLGLCNREEVAEIYSRAMIGCATLLNVGQYNISDNLATKVYEYMAMGLPVIISGGEFIKSVMDEYRFGICVDPQNVEQIADALKFLFDHPLEARTMGQNGRRAIMERFNWSIEEEKLKKLYSELLREE